MKPRFLLTAVPYLFGELRWDSYVWWVGRTSAASVYHI